MNEPNAPFHNAPHGALEPGAPVLILDTQIVMDWLVFDEPSITPIIDHVVSRRSHWVATEPMRAELLHVLARGTAAHLHPDPAHIADAFARHCTLVPERELSMARPRCSDTDDQKFIDLGLQYAPTHPTCLISRDRAVLKVAKRAAKLGLTIVSPASWLKTHATEAPRI